MGITSTKLNFRQYMTRKKQNENNYAKEEDLGCTIGRDASGKRQEEEGERAIHAYGAYGARKYSSMSSREARTYVPVVVSSTGRTPFAIDEGQSRPRA